MRIVFMGSAEFSCPSLEILTAAKGVEVVGVVTQPDRPRGRSLATASCAVKAFAEQRGLAVQTPENMNERAAVQALRALAPDLIVVVAYGQILRRGVLGVPPLGCVNVHASLLPKYRGAAPIQWAVARGEKTTGVTTMFMDRGMDTGDVILQRAVDVGEEETAGELHDRLARAGADLLAETVAAIGAGRAPRTPQNEAEATFAPKLLKDDGEMDWTLPAGDLRNRVRGFNPWPMCWCTVPARSGTTEGQRLRVLKASAEGGEASARGRPGEVLEAGGAGPLVATGQGALRLLQVQPEGKRPMTGAQYLCGHGLSKGTVLE